MQREVPGDPGVGTSSYWVMPSNTATKICTIFRDRVITSLFLQRWSLWCSAVSFGYISFITFWLFVCITSFYLSLTVILTSHFSNITYFRQQQQQNKPMKYYEILPTHTETPRNTTRKIANLYIEFNYHFLTLQKKSHYFWTGVYNWQVSDDFNKDVYIYTYIYRYIYIFGGTLPWASCQIRKIAGCACAGNAENVFPATAG